MRTSPIPLLAGQLLSGHLALIDIVHNTLVVCFLPTVPTKEAAFIDALMSASLVHHIAQGCAKGTLGTACSCGEVLPYTVGGETLSWFWGNCSVNVKYGQQFVERLSYPPRYQQPSKLPQTDLIRLLNSATGRRVRMRCICSHCQHLHVS